MRQTLLLITILFAVPVVAAPAETAAPATCTAEANAEASAFQPPEVDEEGIEAIGVPESTAMACANQWYEYRWVYGGCCAGNQKKTKEQRRECCFDQTGTHCSGWVDTGAFNCGGYCPI